MPPACMIYRSHAYDNLHMKQIPPTYRKVGRKPYLYVTRGHLNTNTANALKSTSSIIKIPPMLSVALCFGSLGAPN